MRIFRTPVAERRYVITAAVRWDLPARVREKRIQYPEPIAFWFGDSNAFRAPQVRSDRLDFPRDLPHLNPVSHDEPASLCLARDGITSLYRRGGVGALLQRISTWLRDAAAQQLDHDGWEPMPRPAYLNAVMDIEWFQEMAYRSDPGKSGSELGSALLYREESVAAEQRIHAQLLSTRKDIDRIWTSQASEPTSRSRSSYESVWYMAWGKRAAPSRDRFSRPIESGADLLALAEAAGCRDQIQRFVDVVCRVDAKNQVSFLVVVIGTWRDRRLIPTIPGLGKGDAGHLELDAFLVFMKETEGGREIGAVYTMRVAADGTPNSLNKLAGYDSAPDDVLLIGGGALGSKIGQHLIREGSSALTIVDYDRFAPHNLSRHILTREAVHFSKANEIMVMLKAITPYASVAAQNVDVSEISEENWTGLMKSSRGVIVDCSADLSVQRSLARKGSYWPVVRLELADRGRLGFLLSEGAKRNPRIDDLRAQLPLLAIDSPAVAAWLQHPEEDALLVGIGCASASSRVPDGLVSAHAGNFMATLGAIVRRPSRSGGIGVATADEQGHLTGWRWIDVSSVTVLPRDKLTQWTARISNVVLQRIAASARSSAPREAGGYLFGSFDVEARTVYITWTGETTALHASESRLTLPPVGTAGDEIELLSKTKGQVRPLGAWHSHPGGSPRASNTDLLQLAKSALAAAASPSPHVSLIYAARGLNVLFGIPLGWA